MDLARFLSVALTAALVTVVPVPVEARAAAPLECGTVITTDTRLTHDLLDCPEHGLVIGADDVTLDLGGHLVDGDGEGLAAGVFVIGHDRVVIKNGAVRDFVDGVHVDGGTDVLIRGVQVSRSSHVGVAVADAERVRILDTSVRITPYAGFFVHRTKNVRISGNVSTRNGAGIDVLSSHRVRVANNFLARNVTGLFVRKGSGAEVLGNLAHANAFTGLVIEANGATVRRNLIRANGNGIIVVGNRVRVQQNEVIGAVSCIPVPDACLPPTPGPCSECEGGNGIAVEGGRRVVVGGNEVVGTVRHGIVLAAYVPPLPMLGAVIRNNRIRGAGRDGIVVLREGSGRLTGTLLDGNRVRGSGGDGLDVRVRHTTVTSNLAVRNAVFGIRATGGVTDGGDNRARHNGHRPQCRNITCS